MREPTVGVEEEYQLVDPESGALRSRADRVLSAAWSEDLEAELQQTMLEIQTPPCASAAELTDALRRRRLTAAATAAAEGLEIVAAGTHPFSPWRGHSMADDDRSEALERRFGRVARTEHIFGTHIHVALPDGPDPARLMTELRWLTPVLVALTASSPFFEGEDTGYASYRSIVQRRLPLTGPPPALGSMAEHEALLDALVRTGLAPDRRTVYWNVRLNPRYPTLEFRGTDACPTLADVVAVTALVRAAVVHVAEGGALLPGAAESDETPAVRHVLLEASEWQAARYGLDGTLAVPGGTRETGGRDEGRTLRAEVRRLLTLLRSTMDRLGDAPAGEHLADMVERGPAADRIRAIHARDGDLVAVVDWLREESQLGLGRAR